MTSSCRDSWCSSLEIHICSSSSFSVCGNDNPLETHDPYHHDFDNPTNNTRPNNRYDQDSRPKRRQHQRRRRTRRRRYATHALSINRQLNLHYTKATTSSALVQTAATRVSRDTLTLSATHLPPDTDARPLYSKRQEI